MMKQIKLIIGSLLMCNGLALQVMGQGAANGRRVVFTVTQPGVYSDKWVLKNQDQQVIDLKKYRRISESRNPLIYVLGYGVKVTKMVLIQRNKYQRVGCSYEMVDSKKYVRGHKFRFKDYKLSKNMPVRLKILRAVNIRTMKEVEVKSDPIVFGVYY